jgi:hypothetical protein
MRKPAEVVRALNVLVTRNVAGTEHNLGVQAQSAAFVAPEPRSERVEVLAVQSGEAQTPRRYKGRASSQRRVAPAGSETESQSARPRPVPVRTSDGRIADAPQRPVERVVAQAWSIRLAAVTALICTVLVGARAVGLFTPAIDAGAGTEAASYAYVSILTGRTNPVVGAGRLLPPVAPWVGETPYDPAAGVPVHAWLTVMVEELLGEGAWAGRAVAIFFSIVAAVLLFGLVRRTGGTRAALYALLLFAVAPLSVTLGQQFSGASAILASQAAALLALVVWREQARVGRGGRAWAVALGSAALAGMLDPAAIFLAAPAAYLMLYEPGHSKESSRSRTKSTTLGRLSSSLGRTHRGKLAGYAAVLFGSSALWWAFTQGYHDTFTLAFEHGGGGISSGVAALLDGSIYVQVVGLSIERLLAVSGILFVVAGLLKGTQPPFKHVLHVWLAAGAVHAVFDGARLAAHEDVILPLILPACALAGVGAAWAGSLPSKMGSALSRQTGERGVRYVVSPHTSWLFDVPEERADDPEARPQARPALGRAVARRTETQILRLRRAGLIAAGHLGVLGVIAYVAIAGAPTTYARPQSSVRGVELSEAGAEVAAATPVGSLLVIAGPNTAELFAASGRTGWAITEDEFNLPALQTLQRQGAGYLLSADREWLGHHADYRGLITNYAVAKLSRNFILFDLSSKPAASDRLYFLESGHTLGGAFRRFWEQNGGVARLGYPISEESQEPNPLDGVTRTVQYFERAVLEFHPEQTGSGTQVMLAAVGRWVTRDRDFPRVRPSANTTDRWYFAETGHSVKQAFLRYWQREGGVAVFGYPISEELPEINASDGKVYTVQYFERARLEWHPTFAGTADEVQLGLIGKQALEMYSR